MKKQLLPIPMVFFTIICISQNVGIGTHFPTARLHVVDSSVLFSAFPANAPVVVGNPPASGEGRRMMWYADKAAFRAGYVSGTQWNKDSVGLYSIAMGFDAKAKGNYSLAMGYDAKATGVNAVAIGSGTSASAASAMAMGFQTAAISPAATALGVSTKASGDYS